MPYLAGTTEESNVDTDVINDTTTGENTNTNTNDTNNSNTNTSNNSSSDSSSTTNTTDTTNSNSGTNTTTDTNAIENGSTDTNNTTSSTTEKEVVIEHNGKSYKNKDIIEVPYSRELDLQTFELKNIDKDSNRIEWSLHKDFEAISAEKYLGKGERISTDVRDIGGAIVLQAAYWSSASSYTNGDSKKIRVLLKIPRKEFELEELVALHQGKRLAKSGEILYLLHPPTSYKDYKKVDYGIKISPRLKEKEIPKYHIQWSFDTNKNPEYYGKKTFTRNLRARDVKYVTSVHIGSPNKLEKSVDVKWVKQYDNSFNYLSKFNKVLVFLEQFNRIAKKFNTLLPCEGSILGNYEALAGAKKIAFNLKGYNEEDKESRELFDVLQTTLKLQSASLANFECGKNIGYLGVSIGKIYDGIDLGANINFIYKLKTKNETGKSVNQAFIDGGFNLTSSFGFKSNEVIDKYFYAKAAIELSIGTKTEYPYNNKNYLIGNYLYLGRTNFVVDGYVDTWLTGREAFNFKFLIFDSSWKSKKRLVFDLKNKNIYLE
ncbi:hypothetical protein [Tenacibaculum maritimum]|uniref:hypothetical protein n=1 Tax=Tenacibaculum maritimum TaxID=107401 RepID=UPI001E316833|nr:hypothetical protein [Tenacibaculum maritimum]MCD9579224.1 hypothetical protein [Tenacibaculum maritimum]